MFDLKSWQKQLEQQLQDDAEKNQIWQHQIKPVVAQLLPLFTSIEQQLERQAESRQASQQYDIISAASEPQSIPPGFSSMLPADVRKQLWMKSSNDAVTSVFFSFINSTNVIERDQSFYLHGAICYGDEALLQQQNVHVTFHAGEEQCSLIGKYVPYRAVRAQIDELLQQAKRVGKVIPFIVDYYAERFYVLQLNGAHLNDVKHWKKVDRVDVAPLDVAEQVNVRLYEEPIWNLDIVELKHRQSKRKLLPNGLHRREFEDAKRRTLLPIIPVNSMFYSLVEEAETNQLVVTAELPADVDTLHAYVVQPVSAQHELHNRANMPLPKFAKEPTIADLHALTASFSFLQPLTIEFAKLEFLPVKPGDLWRRDCLVLTVRYAEDQYTASRLRALEQCVLNYFSYAACRAERVGDGHAK